MNTPWHLWVVGIFAVLFNAGGAFDYVMTQTANETYMSQFSADQIAWFDRFPRRVQASWAIAVWSAVAGVVFAGRGVDVHLFEFGRVQLSALLKLCDQAFRFFDVESWCFGLSDLNAVKAVRDISAQAIQ